VFCHYAIERLNEEVRRRERVIRIFPTRASVIRLLGALLMEHDEQWSTGKRYLDMRAYWQWRGLNLQLQERPDSEQQTRPPIPRGVE
jgi:transposase-like protein